MTGKVFGDSKEEMVDGELPGGTVGSGFRAQVGNQPTTKYIVETVNLYYGRNTNGGRRRYTGRWAE